MSEQRMECVILMESGEIYECGVNDRDIMQGYALEHEEVLKVYYSDSSGEVVEVTGDEVAVILNDLIEEKWLN
ncbi:hypothetical protein [Desulfosediminicola ganghwensis]|uniref:hypothetical protein n=1 Tax=Desulfosediminicola ganghwensis TaxID=2569540 RepID=UPI0010AC0C69|nr:hypothetical protein [Desulfosediminicola ganghwensis]